MTTALKKSLETTSALVSRVQLLIVETFDVSEREAHDLAMGLVSLAEGWGTLQSATQLDWSFRVKKDLGKKLRWRSEAERGRFESDKKKTFEGYDAFIRNQKHT